VLSALVGERGAVVGVDMTDEQLAIAERHIEYHREQNWLTRSANVRVRQGLPRASSTLWTWSRASFDLIVSRTACST
jgi:arsenite methyltransferase